MRTSMRRLGLILALTGITALAALAAPGTASAAEPAGTAFGEACVPVQVIAIPGSYEISDGASTPDPGHVTDAITRDVLAAAGNLARVHFIGYPAKIVHSGPSWLDGYGDSRRHGYEATYSTLKYYASQCASTKFILYGYSQGAHIAGDLAATIGGGNGPVSPDRVLSVRLLADPARNPAFPTVGIDNAGALAGWGIDGNRSDFGALSDRTTEYCDVWDGICNLNAATLVAIPSTPWSTGPHFRYQQTVVPGTDQTFAGRIASDIIQNIYNPAGVTF